MSTGLLTVAIISLFASTIMIETAVGTFLPNVELSTLSAEENINQFVSRRAMKNCYITPGKGPPVMQ
jgi:hypothetical protein